jgi:DoxX-like family
MSHSPSPGTNMTSIFVKQLILIIKIGRRYHSIRHLGYPGYFGILLTIFKVTGACVLIIPRVPARIREWAYAGFVFEFLFAFLSYIATDGFGVLAFFPLVVLMILLVSYVNYHRIKERSLSVSL